MNYKNIKPFAIVIVFIALVIFFAQREHTTTDGVDVARAKKPHIEFFSHVIEPLDLITIDNKEFCFANYYLSTWNDGTYMLDLGGRARIQIKGSKATGDFSFMVGDGWYGTINGTVGQYDPAFLSRIIDGWTDIMSEGQTFRTKIEVYLSGEDNQITLNMNLDNIMGGGGDQQYVYDVVHCDELDEWDSVGQYLREQEIYPNYFILDYKNNTGKLTTDSDIESEDDNQLKSFSYTTNEKHQVLSLQLE